MTKLTNSRKMDLDLGYLSKGLTKRSIMGQCGGSMTSSETAVDDFAMNMVNDFSTTQVIAILKCEFNRLSLGGSF